MVALLPHGNAVLRLADGRCLTAYTAECGGIEPPRPYYGRKPVLKTGRATRPTHSLSYGRVYYIACLWRRVSTLTSPVRLVTPQASEYSSQAWEYLRLVPRLSRSPGREILPLSLQMVFIRSNTDSAASRVAKSEFPNSTASPRLRSRRIAGVGSAVGGCGPAARRSSSNCSASRSSSGGTRFAFFRLTPLSVSVTSSLSISASRASAREGESYVAVRASATMSSGLSGRSAALRFRDSRSRSLAAAISP